MIWRGRYTWQTQSQVVVNLMSISWAWQTDDKMIGHNENQEARRCLKIAFKYFHIYQVQIWWRHQLNEFNIHLGKILRAWIFPRIPLFVSLSRFLHNITPHNIVWCVKQAQRTQSRPKVEAQQPPILLVNSIIYSFTSLIYLIPLFLGPLVLIDSFDTVPHFLKNLERWLQKFQRNQNWEHVNFTWDAPRKLTKIQSRVLPLLTAPPNPVSSVSVSVLNFVWITFTVLSNIMLSPVQSLLGSWCRRFVEYLFVWQGVLQLNL